MFHNEKSPVSGRSSGLSLPATANPADEPRLMEQIAVYHAECHKLVTELDHGLACLRNTLLGHESAVVADLPWDPAPNGIVPEQRASAAMLRARLDALLNHVHALHAV